jgi:hypothetical protein
MNNNKFLLGSLIGGIVAFFAGFILYTLVFKSMLADACPGMASTQKDPNMLALVIGNLATGTVLAYIFERWAKISTLATGAMGGAVVGALVGLSFDCMMMGTSTTIDSWGCVCLDVVIGAILWGVAGAAIGWFLGFKRD